MSLRLSAPPPLITILAALLYFSTPAVACTCGKIQPCEAYAYARVVFVGVVTRPAAGVSVVLQNPRTGSEDGNSVLTDSQGKFTVIGVEGQTYELSALVHKGIPLVHSKPVLVKVEKVNRPVRLMIESP